MKFKPVYILMLALFAASCANPRFQGGGRPQYSEYDLGFVGVPIYGQVMSRSTVVDAVEEKIESLEDARYVMTFKVNQVFKGEIPKIRRGGPSEFQQAKSAAKKGKIMQILTLDFRDPDDMIDRGWLNVAVMDPAETFDIPDWKNPEGRPYEIYLRKAHGVNDRFVLVQSRDAEKMLRSAAGTEKGE